MTPKKDAKWRDLPEAGIIPDAGNAREYETGSWRTAGKPLRDPEKCIDCFLCWINCPDMAIVPKDGKISTTQFLYEYCKGCGICAAVCPPKVCAITMVPEEQEVPV
ncbi:MAG: 4Fe-4S dicluster domain-containing protein [Armatimonadota bacterium]